MVMPRSIRLASSHFVSLRSKGKSSKESSYRQLSKSERNNEFRIYGSFSLSSLLFYGHVADSGGFRAASVGLVVVAAVLAVLVVVDLVDLVEVGPVVVAPPGVFDESMYRLSKQMLVHCVK